MKRGLLWQNMNLIVRIAADMNQERIGWRKLSVHYVMDTLFQGQIPLTNRENSSAFIRLSRFDCTFFDVRCNLF